MTVWKFRRIQYFCCFCRKRWRVRTSWCRGSWGSPKSLWWEWTRGPKMWFRSGLLPLWRGGRRRPRASPWWDAHDIWPHTDAVFSYEYFFAIIHKVFFFSISSCFHTVHTELTFVLCRSHKTIAVLLGVPVTSIPHALQLLNRCLCLPFQYPCFVSALRVNEQHWFNLADLVEAQSLLN